MSSAASAVTELGARARLALEAVHRRPTVGIPNSLIHIMEQEQIERLAGAEPGDYVRDPDGVYMAMQRAIGACAIDQYLAKNPLSMSRSGLEKKERGATTGAERIERDGMLIDSPEAVAEHLERFVFPALEAAIAAPAGGEDEAAAALVAAEREMQARFGPEILKIPYGKGYNNIPGLRYGTYGYANYFMAYALFPEVIEKDFRLQGELAERKNRAAARAYMEGGLPPLLRLDHDMADSRGTLVDIKSLDKIWFPHFTRAIEPYIEAGVKLIWHCDGNLMQMVPRLLEAGLSGFQGFQYEDGMEYEKICKMTTRDGESLIIQAGVSVTRTLPMGTPDDVRREMKWLVENGPETGLFLAGSSSVAPGVPAANLDALVEGLRHYRVHGRS